MGATGPALVGGALIKLNGHTLALPPGRISEGEVADRAMYVSPSMLLEDLLPDPNPDTIVQPMLDVLWQAFGFEKCFYYDQDNKFSVR